MALNDNEPPGESVLSDRGRRLVLRGAMMAVSASWAVAATQEIVPLWTGPIGIPGLVILFNGLTKPANDNTR